MAGGLGTGSNKVVTLNLPHIALQVKGEKNFFSSFDQEIEVARIALQESNRIIKRSIEKWRLLPFLQLRTKDGAPYYNFEERRLTLGVIGLNECLLNLIGKPLNSLEGKELGLKIISHLGERIKEFSRENGVVYTLEQTPAESATHKLALKDRMKYGKKARVQGKGKNVYYTNSTFVPFKPEISLIEKIEIESEFHPYFNGGAICHIWICELKPDLESLKNLVKKMSETKLAYFAFSPDFSVCSSGHLERGIHKVCPQCGTEAVDHLNRVVGYFTRVSNWNPGKRAEYGERRRYRIE